VTYFADLAPFTYLGPTKGPALAVGWLEADHGYERGEVVLGVVEALERLFVHAWEPICAGGWHDCSLCPRKPTDGPITREIAGRRELLGVKNLLLPAGDVIYATPSLVIHYIEDHGYKPPDEFIKALLELDPAADEYEAECRRLFGESGWGVSS